MDGVMELSVWADIGTHTSYPANMSVPLLTLHKCLC